MDNEVKSHMLDVIAFMMARFKDDEAAAIALLGLKEYPTPEEADITGERLTNILLGMTDFAISGIKAMAMMVGCTPEKMMETLCMQMALWDNRG